ncbi:MAG: hypothetical protein ACBR12_00960 [Microcoleus sp.]
MNSTQLKLFSEPATGNLYKAGDWIKVRKKPTIAAWVKRGEIFQINAVSPKDGSIRFWNPYIDQWDFLYPDEIKLTVEPVVEESSKLNVESVVENLESPSTVESVVENLESPSIVESVVENLESPSIVESVVENLESPSIVESVVENLESPSTVEYVVENLDNRRDSGYNSNGWIDYHYKIRINGKQISTRQKKEGKCTGPYYTYRWLENKKQRAKYLPSKKYGEVYQAIAMGEPVNKILEIISNPSKLETILKK